MNLSVNKTDILNLVNFSGVCLAVINSSISGCQIYAVTIWAPLRIFFLPVLASLPLPFVIILDWVSHISKNSTIPGDELPIPLIDSPLGRNTEQQNPYPPSDLRIKACLANSAEILSIESWSSPLNPDTKQFI